MKLRRLLLLLVAVIVLAAGAIVALGWRTFPPDRPAQPSAGGAPGDGGLRRPFPAMPIRPDNPVTPKRVALGRLLYFDPVLSGANDISCASCHHPDLGLSDGRGQSMGKGGKGLGPERAGGAVVKRGAPTVWNAAFNHRQFWDGRAADLEDQARFPITSALEMDQKPDELVGEIRAIPEYVRLFDEAFDGKDGSALTFDNTTRAIADFERTLVSDDSPFDRYRMGDATALTPAERRGLDAVPVAQDPLLRMPRLPDLGQPRLQGDRRSRPARGRRRTSAGPRPERAPRTSAPSRSRRCATWP